MSAHSLKFSIYAIILRDDLQGWFNFVSDLLILKPCVSVTEQVQSFTSKPSAFPEFPQSPGDDIEKTAQLRSISLPGIASIKGKFLYHGVIREMFKVVTF